MLKSFFLFFIMTLFFSNCHKTTVDPTLPDCQLTSISIDTIRTDLKYNNGKLIKEELINSEKNYLLSYSQYSYEGSKIYKSYHNADGTISKEEQFVVNNENSIILYTSFTKGDGDFGIYDTTRYTYDSKGYLILEEKSNWQISISKEYYNHSEHTIERSYPTPGKCIITYNYPNSAPSSYDIEYYTNLDANANSFKYLPFNFGKGEHLLTKKNHLVTFHYVLDSNKNIIEQQSNLNGSNTSSIKFSYNCQ